MAKGKGQLEVWFSDAAHIELHGIWTWNAVTFGSKRANDYLRFIYREVERLSRFPSMGREVPDYPGLRRVLIKRRSRGHGHILFFRIQGDRLEVAHIFHTSQDWQLRLEDE